MRFCITYFPLLFAIKGAHDFEQLIHFSLMVSAFRSIYRVISYTLKRTTSISCVSNSLILLLRAILHSSKLLSALDEHQHPASCSARGFNNYYSLSSFLFSLFDSVSLASSTGQLFRNNVI